MLCLLLSLSASLFIYFTIGVEEHMHQIAAAAAVRTESARAAALVMASQTPHLDVCGLDLPGNVSQSADGMELHHRSITSGDLVMKVPPLLPFSYGPCPARPFEITGSFSYFYFLSVFFFFAVFKRLFCDFVSTTQVPMPLHLQPKRTKTASAI